VVLAGSLHQDICAILCLLCRMMAALGRDLTRTNVFGSLAMVLLILLGGFALKRPDVVSGSTATQCKAYTSSKARQAVTSAGLRQFCDCHIPLLKCISRTKLSTACPWQTDLHNLVQSVVTTVPKLNTCRCCVVHLQHPWWIWMFWASPITVSGWSVNTNVIPRFKFGYI
jgi:hypothetical protein